MTRMLRVALGASLLLAACGTAPTAPISAVAATPQSPIVALTLNVSLSATPFHVATPGEIRYEVTGVTALASVEYSSTDGEIESGVITGPAPAVGVVRLTYRHAGTFTATLKATTMPGTTLQASVTVNVVD
jgi:hypothetical protein